MSKSFSFDILDSDMLFVEERDRGNTANRRNKMKRMEELSHSMDNGLNYIQDEYYDSGGKGGGRPSSNRTAAPSNRGRTTYNDEEDDDYNDDEEDDEFIDDYYYNNSKTFDGRPKSYNEKYSYMYDYDTGRGKANDNYRYSMVENQAKQHPRYPPPPLPQQPLQSPKSKQYQQPTSLRRNYDLPYKSSGSSGNGNHGSPKHILFNDEDDVCYMMDKKQQKSSKEQHSKTSKSKKTETKKEKEPSSPSFFSMKKSSKDKDKEKEKEKEKEKSSKSDESEKVIKARLKLQNVACDDSVIQTRTTQKTPIMLRHHSIESKSPAHGSDHKISPTILEEIEYETQDEETEYKCREPTPPPPEKPKEKEKDSKSKEKSSSKEKKNDTPSTPTSKKSSFRAHLVNHKKLFKVPDIDLNNLKLSCLFSSTRNMAIKNSANNTTPPKTPTESSTQTPPTPGTPKTGAKKSKSADNIFANKLSEMKQEKKIARQEKQPTKSEKQVTKPEKQERVTEKSEKLEKFERMQQKDRDRTVNSRSSINVQSSSENFVEDTSAHSNSISDVEYESQAMRVVRTVGQAFEVCHKLSIQKKSQEPNDDNSELISDLDQSDIQNLSDFDEPKKALDTTPILQQDTPVKRPNHLDNLSSQSPSSNLLPSTPTSPTTPTKLLNLGDENKENSREIQQLRDQLQHQSLQTKQALAQLLLVREQLMSEQNARIEAQQRTQQLLQQNRELLEHIASLSGLNDAERPGLTPANIGLAPQSQLNRYLQQLGLLGAAGGNMMGTNLMNKVQENHVDELNNNTNKNTSSISGGVSFSPTFNMSNSGSNMALQQHLANINMENLQLLNKMPFTQQYNKQQQEVNNLLAQQELFNLNQELLNRLKNINLGYSTTPTSLGTNFSAASNNYGTDPSSYIFSNANAQSFLNNNANINNNPNTNNNSSNLNNKNSSISNNDIIGGVPGLNNVPSSPLGTLNRSSSTYSTISPLDDNLCLSFDRSLDNINNNNQSNDSQFIKPLSQVGALTTLDADGKVKVIVPVHEKSKSDNDFFGEGGAGGSSGLQRPQVQQKTITPILSRGEKKVTLPGVVTVKVTDEQGNVRETNQRKLPAQPSFITRSTSEKVPNRSTMMQAQRTQWARHTTK